MYVARMIPLTRPWMGDEEIRAVTEVLRSGMLVQGVRVAAFEALVAQKTGRAHAIAVDNGTGALVLGLKALGIGPGDEVLCPGLTWPSPAHAILTLGATPVLVDVDPDEWNATPQTMAAAVTDRTRAAIVIDQFGAPVRTSLEQLGVPLVEDAACSLGSTMDDGRPAGKLGRLATLSFHPRKVLTTGEGGIVVTDDRDLADELRARRNHGQTGPGEFLHPSSNHRLTDIQAAIGEAQMERLETVVALRRAHAETIRAGLPTLVFQRPATGAAPNEQTLGALLPAGTDKAALIAAAREKGVQIGALSYALSKVPTTGSCIGGASLPVAEDIAERGIALPLFPQMTEDDCATVVEVVSELLAG